jgi:hypothetical protein
MDIPIIYYKFKLTKNIIKLELAEKFVKDNEILYQNLKYLIIENESSKCKNMKLKNSVKNNLDLILINSSNNHGKYFTLNLLII